MIVSVQGVEDEPTNDAHFLAISAKAVVSQGIKVLRVSQVEHIKAIQKEVNVPLIALIKKNYTGSEVFITPTTKEIDELAKLNINAIALDATLRKRPNNQSLAEIVKYAREKYPNIALMADCSTIEDATQAAILGFDIISTTLRGYTKETMGMSNTENDFDIIKQIVNVKLNSLVITEGGIWTPAEAKRALQISDAVVVGSAITRPHDITKKYLNGIK